ncbi:MAG: hypothetical protein Q8N34_03440 [Gammaproteobacteria bacterium]|nr:hypothetical protein [Gammaproteobacteria bacterium]
MRNTEPVTEDKLDAASSLLRSHGYLVLRPCPFRYLDMAEHMNRLARRKSKAPKETLKKPPRESKTAERVAIIREHAGRISREDIAQMLGITVSNLSFIASTNKISLKVRAV